MSAPEGSASRDLGDGIVTVSSWSFSGGVADVFLDHVRRSVPTYDFNHDLACAISSFFCRPSGRVYDLGTSTGQLLIRLAQANAQLPGIEWVGYDCEPEMIAAAERRCGSCELAGVTVEVADIAEVAYERCDFVSAYLVLQFLPIHRRETVVRRVFHALRDGGGMFLFEKVQERDSRIANLVEALHHDFKHEHGLGFAQIANKARALAPVLEPRTSAENLLMLRQAGFRNVAAISRYLCFEGYLAIK
jgi:tRNA (cmo5U34)-methyltransferase